MPAFEASALNDNDEEMAFLWAVLSASGSGARPRAPAARAMSRGSPGAPLSLRSSSSGVPLIVGVAVSIILADR